MVTIIVVSKEKKMKVNKINPVIQPVMDSFDQVYYQTLNFAKNPESAINGLLVMGDAGMGKSHHVQDALRDAGAQHRVEYIKGGTITAAAAYVKLYLNRDSHRIMVFDDIDIFVSEVRTKIIPMLLGALQEGNDNKVTWSTARKNALMEEFDVPFEFNFNGKIILITNYTKADLEEKLKALREAFSSRFNDVECIFTKEQKYMYTKHLIENVCMLGKQCKVHHYKHKGKKINGYPQPVIDDALEFIDDNYHLFKQDITPRVAIKVTDMFMYYTGREKDVMLRGLVNSGQ